MAKYKMVTAQIVDTDKPPEPKREWQGMWIPKAVWLDTNLTWMEKLFLVEVNSLDNDKHCFASNDYFCKIFNLKTSRVSEVINSLIKKEYLSAEYVREGKQIVQRLLTVLCKNPFGKPEEPPSGNRKDINTSSINTTSKEGVKEPKASKEVKYTEAFEIIWKSYPNDKSKRDAYSKYKTRLKEGVSPEVLLACVQNYCLEVAEKNTTYIMHGATFFGVNKRYEDYKKAPKQDSEAFHDKYCKKCGTTLRKGACPDCEEE